MVVTGFDVNGALQQYSSLEAQLQATLNVIPAYTWYALPSGALTFVNERCADYLGLPRDHSLRFGIVTGGEWDSHIPLLHPDDQEESRRAWSTCLRIGSESEQTFRVRSAEGAYRWFLSRAEPLRGSDGTLLYWIGVNLDITEQKRAEESLRKSEAYLADAQKLSQTGSWAWSPEVGITHWSEECYRVQGFDPRDGLPRFEELLQRIHPDDQPKLKDLMQGVVRDKTEFETDYRLVHPDGAVRDIHSTAHPVFSPTGDLIEFMGTVIDVTERKRAEENLRAGERKYRNLVDTTPAFIHTASPDGALDFLSRGWLEYGGLTLRDLKDWHWTATIHPEDVERFVDTWRAALASGEPFEAKSRVRRADGEYRWFLQRNVPLRDEAGKIVKWYGTGMDVTEQEHLMDALRKSEEELRQMLDLAPQLVSVYGPNRERLHMNRVALDYLGVSLEEWRQAPERGGFIHPDDRARWRDVFDRALSTGSAYELELRLRRGDGSYRWFLARSNPVRDDKGQIRRWYVARTDIQDRKRAEEKLQQENVALREEIDKVSMFEDIVGSSAALKQVLSKITKVAPTDSTVLITGETGTGKELVARAIHAKSKRAGRAFIPVNCAAIPQELIASELFGHEKGAFTGALQRRIGRFESADGGTIFLDEVGELPAETQVSLLRALQEREFERIGSNQPIRVDVRVLTATNRDLNAAVAAGKFREDLFYRLNVFPIAVPSLRERSDDIRLLVEYMLERSAKKAGKKIKQIDKKTLDLFEAYGWPGNVRELQNVIERAVILCEGDTLSVDPSWFGASLRGASDVNGAGIGERERIEAALMASKGRVAGPFGAANKLGIPRQTLDSRIAALGIDKYQFRR